MTVFTNNLINDLSSSTMHSVGWALLHFLWQGSALAALAAAAMSLCRRASTRYATGVVVLLVMWLAPFATVLFYSQQNRVTGSHPDAKAFAIRWITALPKSSSAAALRQLPSTPERDVLPWLVEAWLLGVVFFSVRSSGGFFLLQRHRRRRGSRVNAHLFAICQTLQARMGIRRAVQFCESAWMQAPAVVGWFSPIVFLPASALTGLSEDQLKVVIAHELAHIRRFDAFVNVFQVCVETLLFYHPAVWWLNKRIRAEREHCCDEMAVSLCGNVVEYARALTLMEEWRSAPRLAMAANRGPLAERIGRLLGLKTLGTEARSVGLAASILCLAAALIAGNALLGLAHPRFVRAAAGFQASAAATPATPDTPSAKPSPSHPQSNATSQHSTTAESGAASYIDAMKAAGLSDLTVDQLIALKTQDVTPDYVRGLRALGLHLDVNKIIAMRIQDVTPEYIRALRDAGLNADEDQIISMKIQDADANYYRELKDAGIQCDVNRLISMKIQGVTGAYVRELRAAGLSFNADQVISLKIQDVTPAYLKEMHEQGIDPNTDDAIAMRIQDVTPDYVRQIHALGLKPSTHDLISMHIQDVTPEYVKALQSAGFNANVNEIISAKIQDVTPEFIDQVRKHGFKDLTLEKLIQLRQLGILDSEQKADL